MIHTLACNDLYRKVVRRPCAVIADSEVYHRGHVVFPTPRGVLGERGQYTEA